MSTKNVKSKATKPTENTTFFDEATEFEEVRLSQNITALDEVNPTIRGIFLGVEVLLDEEGKPKVNEQYGNEMEYANFRSLNGEEKIGVWCDGGLRGALNFNKVKAGMAVRITYTGRKEIETDYGLKDIKQYEIVGLQVKGTKVA